MNTGVPPSDNNDRGMQQRDAKPSECSLGRCSSSASVLSRAASARPR
ncbi:hypothetical protein ACFPRL_02920 [Pseudoclavibacter helvolus]